MHRRLSENQKSLESPIAESTCINVAVRKPLHRVSSPRYGSSSTLLHSPAKQSPHNRSLASRRKLNLSQIDPRMYADVHSSGLTSRIVKYHESVAGHSLQRSMSASNLYSVPRQFPSPQKSVAPLPYKATLPTVSMTRIAPPDRSFYCGNSLSSLLRSNSILGLPKTNEELSRENRPILHPPPHESEPTRSVLEALKEISRKRINTNDAHQQDFAKKTCTRFPDYVDGMQLFQQYQQPPNFKRQRELTVAVPMHQHYRPVQAPICSTASPQKSPEQLAKRRNCSYSNDITSSLSSSRYHSQKRKLFDMHARQQYNRSNGLPSSHLNDNTVRAVGSGSSPESSPGEGQRPIAKIQRQQNSTDLRFERLGKSLSCATPITPLPETPSNQVSSNGVAPQRTISAPLDRITQLQEERQRTPPSANKPKLTLFNAPHAQQHTREQPEMPSDADECAGIQFVKPKQQSSSCGTKPTAITRTEKTKLALMLSSLRGEIYQGELLDELDAPANDIIVPPKSVPVAVPTTKTTSTTTMATSTITTAPIATTSSFVSTSITKPTITTSKLPEKPVVLSVKTILPEMKATPASGSATTFAFTPPTTSTTEDNNKSTEAAKPILQFKGPTIGGELSFKSAVTAETASSAVTPTEGQTSLLPITTTAAAAVAELAKSTSFFATSNPIPSSSSTDLTKITTPAIPTATTMLKGGNTSTTTSIATPIASFGSPATAAPTLSFGTSGSSFSFGTKPQISTSNGSGTFSFGQTTPTTTAATPTPTAFGSSPAPVAAAAATNSSLLFGNQSSPLTAGNVTTASATTTTTKTATTTLASIFTNAAKAKTTAASSSTAATTGATQASSPFGGSAFKVPEATKAFSFGTGSTGGASATTAATTTASPATVTPASGVFSFGSPGGNANQTSAAPAQNLFSFGSKPAAAAAPFSFSGTATTSAETVNKSDNGTPTKPAFTFGSDTKTPTGSNLFSFGSAAPAAPAPTGSPFGTTASASTNVVSTTTPFGVPTTTSTSTNLGQSFRAPTAANNASPFGTPAVPVASIANNASPFGTTASVASNVMTFGASAGANKPSIFGATTTTTTTNATPNNMGIFSAPATTANSTNHPPPFGSTSAAAAGTNTQPQSPFGSTMNTANNSSPFGSLAASANTQPQPLFGSAASTTNATNNVSPFGAVAATANVASPFGAPVTTKASNVMTSPFGGNAGSSTASPAFSFGSAPKTNSLFGGNTGADTTGAAAMAATKPFTFGADTSATSQSQQPAANANNPPTAGGFSFGSINKPQTTSAAPVNLFAQNSNASPALSGQSSFNFGSNTAASTNVNPSGNVASTFGGFGSPQNKPFAFNATPSTNPTPAPMTNNLFASAVAAATNSQTPKSGGFSFGNKTASNTPANSAPFAFGANATPTAAAPSSNTAKPFTFGASPGGPAMSNGNMFGNAAPAPVGGAFNFSATQATNGTGNQQVMGGMNGTANLFAPPENRPMRRATRRLQK